VVACALSFAACGGSGTLTGAGGMGGARTGGGIVGSAGLGVTMTGIGGIPGGIGLVGGGDTGIGGTGDGSYCGRAVRAMELPPRLVAMLDGSLSMNDDMNAAACSGGCGQSSKWAAAVEAINTVAVESEPHALWGLGLFGIEDTDVCGIGSVDVPPVFGSPPVITARLRAHSTANGGVASGPARQTRGAVNAASTFLFNQTDSNDNVIVLMTDGVPTCSAGGGAPAADDTLATVEAITRARTGGFPTFVVGIATGGGPAHDSLTMMGNAAGVVGFNAGASNYFAASSVAELRSALRAVVDMTGGCTFEVPRTPGAAASRSNIAVTLGDLHVAKDSTHVAGWDFVSDAQTAVRLYGPPCDAARSVPAPQVSVVFYCLIQ